MRVVALDRRAIAALAGRPAVVSAFPFMRQTIPPDCCGKKPQPDVAAIANQLAVLSLEGQTRLKSLLSADQVVIYLASGAEVRF